MARLWIAGASVLLVALLTIQLFWLVWRYVPLHAAIFEGAAMELTREMRIAIAASNWMVRILPFMILAGLPLGALTVVGGALVAMKVGMRALARVVTCAALLVAFLECLASVLVVRSVHGVYTSIVVSEEYLQTVSECAEYRRQKRAASPDGATR